MVDTLDAIAEESARVRTARGTRALKAYNKAVEEIARTAPQRAGQLLANTAGRVLAVEEVARTVAESEDAAGGAAEALVTADARVAQGSNESQ